MYGKQTIFTGVYHTVVTFTGVGHIDPLPVVVGLCVFPPLKLTKIQVILKVIFSVTATYHVKSWTLVGLSVPVMDIEND